MSMLTPLIRFCITMAVKLLATSHIVVTTENVPKITRFFEDVFSIKPHFENEMFSEFVLPSHFRIAFFKPVGEAAKSFALAKERGTVGVGLTVDDVEGLYASIKDRLDKLGASVTGPPKTHPWGEKSFLLIDPDKNRWEITQSPTKDGMLVNRT